VDEVPAVTVQVDPLREFVGDDQHVRPERVVEYRDYGVGLLVMYEERVLGLILRQWLPWR
jgi:hypothetical protein